MSSSYSIVFWLSLYVSQVSLWIPVSLFPWIPVSVYSWNHVSLYPLFMYPCIVVSPYLMVIFISIAKQVFESQYNPDIVFPCIYVYPCSLISLYPCVPVSIYVSLYPWIPVSLNPCIPVSMYPWIAESLNLWILESLNLWISLSLNPCIPE